MHLAFQNIWPSLCLTLDGSRFPDLWRWIREQKNRYNLKIENVGEMPADSIRGIYANARALIYPSLVESFGLPLIEARKIGLAILSSELDYVRDVVDPEESFDPNSSISIARAVKRYLGIPSEELPIMDCSSFLARLIEETTYDEK
jgi:glycosyltransferase involved in cell wall biosynthesis